MNSSMQGVRVIAVNAQADCRICEQYLGDKGRCYLEYNDTGVCTNGDKFVRQDFTPLWAVAAKPEAVRQVTGI